MKDINWAVLGTGVIANEMAVALKKNGKNIYAVGNRTYEKAVAFGEKYGIGKVYTDYNEMFTDPEVDVIYKIIFSFHMPAFIFVSGYFAKVEPKKIL